MRVGGGARRTSVQAAADRQAEDLARSLGKALKQARKARGLSIRSAGAAAGMSASSWSTLEVGGASGSPLATWNRAAVAVGSRLKAYFAEISAAELPRDAVHLRNQELVMATARPGGWRAIPEVPLDREATTSRMADVVLQRGDVYALCEIWDWFGDVGAASRAWQRRVAALERFAIARMATDDLPRVSGLWVVRATRRNRQLVADHREFFRALLPASSAAWLAALSRRVVAAPPQPALVWASVDGTRLFASRARTA